MAAREMERVSPVFGEQLVALHHVGSTAIPGVKAKAILDLLPVVRDIEAMEALRPEFEALGYAWWHDFGMPGRRYLTLDHPQTGRRLAQLHCFQQDSLHVDRHVAFRDYLIAKPELAREYGRIKAHCAALHGDDANAYTACKNPWIRQVEFEAVKWMHAGGKSAS